MSTFNQVDVTCEQCGEEFQGTLWTAIHAQQDPELKDLLRGGELNLVACPECSHVAFQDHFLIYQDPSAELVAYVYPSTLEAQAPELFRIMMTGFREAQAVFPEEERLPYDPILVFGLELLVDMLSREDERAEQSQIAELLCKENGIAFTMLRPSEARKKGLVRVIPGADSPEKAQHESVLRGLDQLLAINPALSLYCDIRAEVASDEKWSLR